MTNHQREIHRKMRVTNRRTSASQLPRIRARLLGLQRSVPVRRHIVADAQEWVGIAWVSTSVSDSD